MEEASVGGAGRGSGDLLTGEISLEEGEALRAAPDASGPLQEPLDRQLEDLLEAADGVRELIDGIVREIECCQGAQQPKLIRNAP